jgi:hypothetical protein
MFFKLDKRKITKETNIEKELDFNIIWKFGAGELDRK